MTCINWISDDNPSCGTAANLCGGEVCVKNGSIQNQTSFAQYETVTRLSEDKAILQSDPLLWCTSNTNITHEETMSMRANGSIYCLFQFNVSIQTESF